jgi:hypothetical protein
VVVVVFADTVPMETVSPSEMPVLISARLVVTRPTPTDVTCDEPSAAMTRTP